MNLRWVAVWVGISVAGLFILVLGGCRSAFVETTIDNQGETPVRLVEVDYPSASFGASSIAAHSQFHYRFKVQGSGPLKIEFTDAANKIHDADGPALSQGQEGHLTIVIQPSAEVSWQPQMAPSK